MDPHFTSSTSPNVDHVRAGEFPALTEDVTIESGQDLAAHSVLGQVTVGAATPAAVAGNTGGAGTIGAVVVGAGAKAGVYRVFCVEPAANAGKFAVEDPDGVHVGIATVAVEFTGGGVTFTITDATDFVAGDAFTITVAAGSLEYKLALAAATDGSQIAKRILTKAVDASAAAKNAPVYKTGEFAKNKLVFGTGHTAVTVAPALHAENIYLRDTLAS